MKNLGWDLAVSEGAGKPAVVPPPASARGSERFLQESTSWGKELAGAAGQSEGSLVAALASGPSLGCCLVGGSSFSDKAVLQGRSRAAGERNSRCHIL